REPLRCQYKTVGTFMRRREFVALLSGVPAFWPIAAHAQQAGKLPTIGFLVPVRPQSWPGGAPRLSNGSVTTAGLKVELLRSSTDGRRGAVSGLRSEECRVREERR